jgi:hypothetical protein
VVNGGVVIDVALDLGAVALDQRAIVLEGLDQLQNTAHIIGGGLAQFFELLRIGNPTARAQVSMARGWGIPDMHTGG